jgi:hypothetical protein
VSRLDGPEAAVANPSGKGDLNMAGQDVKTDDQSKEQSSGREVSGAT